MSHMWWWYICGGGGCSYVVVEVNGSCQKQTQTKHKQVTNIDKQHQGGPVATYTVWSPGGGGDGVIRTVVMYFMYV